MFAVCWSFNPVSIVHQHSEMIVECNSRSYPSTRKAVLFQSVHLSTARRYPTIYSMIQGGQGGLIPHNSTSRYIRTDFTA
ncbi:hypothetical protein BGY98DRAFT_1049217, partial [Russula aff. rugulosa BPL654]